jgi:hypothetical protein
MIARRFPRFALLLLTGVASVASVCVLACSSTEASTFKNEPDAEPARGPDPDLAFDQDAGTDDGGVCAPSSITGFVPKYKAPAAPNLTACTDAQLDGYYAACLLAPLDEKKCSDFKKTIGTCGTCLDTSDTDPAFGAVVWHDSDKYFTVNIPGCIAIKQKDTGDTGCGATYEALLQCRRASCETCLTGPAASFKKFSDCQRAAGSTTCEDYYKKETAACTTLSTGTPADVCIPPSGSTLKDAFNRIAPIFCGPQAG